MAQWWRRGIVMIAVALAARTAMADPQGMVEVKPESPAPVSPTATKPFTLGATDAAVVASPFEREHRLGMTAGARMLCLNVRASGSCLAGAQVGFDFRYGDVHFGAVGAPNLGSTDPSDPYYAIYGGVEIGSRYYYVAFRRTGTPVSLGVAARASFEFMGLMPALFSNNELRHYFAFANTYGPNMKLLVGSRFAVYARAAIGVGVRDQIDRFSTEPVTAGFAIDAGLGFEARF